MVQRKTTDVYDIEQYTGPPFAWDVVTCDVSHLEACQRVKEWQEKQPGLPLRIVHRRVKIVDVSCTVCKGNGSICLKIFKGNCEQQEIETAR